MYFGRSIRALVVAGIIGVGAGFISLRSYQELVRIHLPHGSLGILNPGELSYLLQERSSGNCLGWYHQTLQEGDGYSLTNFISLNTEFQGRRGRGDVRSDLVFNTLNQLTGGFMRGALGRYSFEIQLEGIENISIRASLKDQESEIAHTFSFHGPVEIRVLESGGIGFHFAGQSQLGSLAQWRRLAESLEAQSSEMMSLSPISRRIVTDGSRDILREECEQQGLATLDIDDMISRFSYVARELYTLEVPRP